MLSLNAVKMSLRTALLRTLIKRTKYNVACLSVREGHNHKQYSNEKWKFYKIGAATALLGSVLIQASLDKKDKNKNKTVEAGEKRPDLPTFRAEEVSKHDSKSSFWVTYKHGVYDVTEFLPSHPGGEQILNAAGLSIEPFWNVYGMHKTPDVYELLESYRIGNLHEDDMVDHSNDELWAKEPYRDKRLIVKTAKPFNAEIPPREQVEHFDTPNELFYVRQHMPVPELQAESHRVKVTVVGAVGAAGAGAGGDRTKCTVFRLQDLARFERRTVRAALMCAGNRRSEMHKVKPVKGIDWKTGAISNAVWTGVYLRDVLIYCGVDVNNTEGKHVILQGADIDATGVNFSTSIPLSMAVHPASEVLLATHMNGVPLPPDHGYPLRAVVPGAPAVRSVKWLESIIVSEEESPSHWHQKDYRSFNPSTTWESADFSTAPPVYSLPVTSAICDPCDGDTVRVKDGSIELRGYAYSGGGAGIVRVDVSGDGGRSWHAARLTPEAAARAHTHYAWTLWTVTLPVDKGIDKMEIWAKATDTNFNTQPERFDHIWNIRGILSNAYHRITVKLQHS